MQKSSQESHPTSSDDQYKCLFFICVNKDGDIEFEFNWGEKPEEIKIFANLLVALTNGGLSDVMIEHIKETCLADPGLKKRFDIFHKTYKNSTNKLNALPKEIANVLVVDPTQVEL